jgi:hypothetical protein
MSALIAEHIVEAFRRKLEEELWEVAEPVMRKKAEEMIAALGVELVRALDADMFNDRLTIHLNFPLKPKEDKPQCPKSLSCGIYANTPTCVEQEHFVCPYKMGKLKEAKEVK